MRKRGMTLIELMVAMSIFMIVMMLGIGGFMSISRARILVGNMKDSQQKLRVINEMVVRYAKQAEYVKLAANGASVEFYFDIYTSPTANKFELTARTGGGYDLVYKECISATKNTCTNGLWSRSASLLGTDNDGMYLVQQEAFGLIGALPSVMNVNLVLRNEVVGFQSLSDDMRIENAIILENLK